MKYSIVGLDQMLLNCPSCDECATHHIAVNAVERFNEDDKKGTSVIVRGHHVSFSSDAEKYNMSNRRGSVSIRFTCEFGCDDFLISFVQHKGATQIESMVLNGAGCSWFDEKARPC